MDIEKLRSFIAVAHHGSISAAADELYLSASAVSKHIAALEGELGVSLFKRSRKSLLLSEDGVICLSYADRIVSEYNEMVSLLCSGGNLSIASIPFQVPILPIISAFSKQFPDTVISISELHGPQILKAVRSGEYELAFAGSIYSDSEDFERIFLLNPRVGVLLQATHPLASSEQISIKQLRNEKFYLMAPKTGLYDYFRGICLENGFSPKVAGTRSREDTIVSLIQYGGVAFMTFDEWDAYPNDKVVFRILQEEYYSGMVLLRAKGKPLSKPAKKLWDFVEKNI